MRVLCRGQEVLTSWSRVMTLIDVQYGAQSRRTELVECLICIWHSLCEPT
jgi:hypothetical protein